MMSPRQRLLFVELTAIASPMLLVLAGKTFLAGAAPVAATVQVSGPALPVIPNATFKPLTPEQQKASEWVRTLADAPDLATPLNHPTEAPKVVVTDKPKISAAGLAGLKLSSIMGRGSDQFASISGRVYRVGDEVRPGYKLTAIDVAQSSVTIADQAGNTYTLRRGKPAQVSGVESESQPQD